MGKTGKRIDRIEALADKILENEERYEAFLNSSPWGILVVDRSFHIMYINKTLEEMSGWALQDIYGKYMHVLLPQEDRAKHAKIEAIYMNSPHDRTGNHGLKPRLLTKSGEIIDVEISISASKLKKEQYYFASIRRLETLLNTLGENGF